MLNSNGVAKTADWLFMTAKPDGEGSESSEGTTEGKDYSKQNSYVRSDNNIQDNYKKSYNNTTNSNNINTQMDND